MKSCLFVDNVARNHSQIVSTSRSFSSEFEGLKPGSCHNPVLPVNLIQGWCLCLLPFDVDNPHFLTHQTHCWTCLVPRDSGQGAFATLKTMLEEAPLIKKGLNNPTAQPTLRNLSLKKLIQKNNLLRNQTSTARYCKMLQVATDVATCSYHGVYASAVVSTCAYIVHCSHQYDCRYFDTLMP